MSCAPLSIPLDPFLYQEPRWCVDCGGEQTFMPVFEFDGGRVGYCLGCEQEKVVLFTRETGVNEEEEAA